MSLHDEFRDIKNFSPLQENFLDLWLPHEKYEDQETLQAVQEIRDVEDARCVEEE